MRQRHRRVYLTRRIPELELQKYCVPGKPVECVHRFLTWRYMENYTGLQIKSGFPITKPDSTKCQTSPYLKVYGLTTVLCVIMWTGTWQCTFGIKSLQHPRRPVYQPVHSCSVVASSRMLYLLSFDAAAVNVQSPIEDNFIIH